MTKRDETGYALGHSLEELERLERQGAFLRRSTKALLQRAGIEPGMRVLDFGCGVGDVSDIAAELVGPTGEVVGIDRAAEAVDLARARMVAKGISHARFVQCDESGAEAAGEGRPFDAVVGRLVLVHQRDPAATVLHLARLTRPGGVLAFHEVDAEHGHWCTHENPLLTQLWRWIGGLVERGVVPRALSERLHVAFERLGVEDAVVSCEGRVVRNSDRGANAWVAGFARTITTPVQKLGIHRDTDLPIDALLDRLHAAEGYNIPIYMIAAHGTLPAQTR